MPNELKALIIIFIILFITFFILAMCISAGRSDEASEKQYREFLRKEESNAEK